MLGPVHPGVGLFARPGVASRVLRIPAGRPLTRHRSEQLGAYRDGPCAVVGPRCYCSASTVGHPGQLDDDQERRPSRRPTLHPTKRGHPRGREAASLALDWPARARIARWLGNRAHQPVKIISLDPDLPRAEPAGGQSTGRDVVAEGAFVHSDVFGSAPQIEPVLAGVLGLCDHGNRPCL